MKSQAPDIHPLPGAALTAKLTPKVVIPVDLFGLPADYDAIMATAAEHGLLVLEDGAQGFGGCYKGRMACSLAHCATTSFFPAKPLGCYGDGGAIFTDDDALAELLVSIRIHGKGRDKYDNVRIGFNGRLDTMQAAILLAKLGVFRAELDARDVVAARYTAALADVQDMVVPSVPDGWRSAWAQYTLATPRRDAALAALAAAGIPAMVYYSKPLHIQTAFAGLGYAASDFPESVAASARVMSLPMHPYLDASTQDQVIAAVRNAVA